MFFFCVLLSKGCTQRFAALRLLRDFSDEHHKYRQIIDSKNKVSEKSPNPAIAQNGCWWLHFFPLLNFYFNEVKRFLKQVAIFLKLYALNLKPYDIYLNLYDINLKVYDICLIWVISFLKFYDIVLNWFKIFFKLVSIFLKWEARNQKHKRIKLIA